MPTYIAYVILAFVSFLAALGQLFFKFAATKDISLFQKLRNPFFVSGVSCFVGRVAVSSLVAKFVDYTIMFASTSLNYLFIFILARVFLRETLDWRKIAGLAIIVCGLLVMVI